MLRFPSILAFLLCCAFLAAQTPNTASIRGQVLDQTKATVSGAEVRIIDSRVGAERVTHSDSAGRFSFSGLPVGSYSLTVHKDQFADLHRDLTLIGGTDVDITLQLSVSQVQTEVVVTAAAGDARAGMPQLGDRLGTEQVQDLPLLNSRITFLPLLNAANRSEERRVGKECRSRWS